MKGNTEPGMFAAGFPGLLLEHYRALHEGSGLSDEIIRARGYTSVLVKKTLLEKGFAPSQCHLPGLLVPIHTPDGKNTLYTYRPDEPRVDSRGRTIKYELPKNSSPRLDVPPRCRAALANPEVELWVSEGSKKGDSLAQHGLCAIDILGVWNFKSKNDFGGVVFSADFDYIALKGRVANVVFDSDIMSKSTVKAALDRMAEHLGRRGATVNAVYLPNGSDGEKVGVDDYLLSHSVAELRALITGPRTAPKAAAPSYELLEEAPATITQPLSLIGPHAYVATWLWVKKTVRETERKNGEIVRHDPPIVTKSRELFIVRDDGAIFGPDRMDEIGLEIRLRDIPPADKLWSKAGVASYSQGHRPDYKNLFERLCGVYNHFLDFGQSFADQPTICELSASCSLVTWLRMAFSVLGYPWPNGEKGSGKTKWGHVWANSSYLGVVLLSSGTFAALRDLADYGAAILFDDAEILTDPKKSDPDKRALLLAGNRKGTSIPIKEPSPDGKGWQTRWINAYCPRGFTSINLPDDVLGSRSLRIPLVRTSDPKRGNSDPSALERWPVNHRELTDDLWAMSLSLLPEAATIWGELDQEPGVVGREFEVFRPILAVARLFERHGVEGLEERMRKAMRAYQAEKSDINTGDRAVQVLKAIICQELGAEALDNLDKMDNLDKKMGGSEKIITVEASPLADTIKRLGELEAWDTAWASFQAVGWQLKILRFERQRDTSSPKRTRSRQITVQAFISLCLGYGLIKPIVEKPSENTKSGPSPPPPDVVQVVQNVQLVQSPVTRPEDDYKDVEP